VLLRIRIFPSVLVYRPGELLRSPANNHPTSKGQIDMMTKTIRTGIAVAALLIAPIAAQAADLPRPNYKAPIYVEPFSWTGFYVGINGGYGWGNSDWSGSGGNFQVAPKGFMGGGTLGYNLQTGVWVWGIEGDIDYMNLKGTAPSAFCASCTFKDTWLGTLRGRVGYSFDRWLPYLTAGAAYGNMYMAANGGSATGTKAGWTAGAGVEYAFLGNWSGKLEYLYVDLGSATCAQAACGFATDEAIAFKANIVRAGLNYRF
jgi:outer membrane immunogenic protein